MQDVLTPIQQREHSRSVELAYTNKIDDYRVGTLREAPPPLQVQTEFDTIHGQLAVTIEKLLQTLNLPEISMITFYLCMAVKHNHLQEFRVKGKPPEYKILLEPTIWIECHNERCITPLSRSLSCLGWLLDWFDNQELSVMYHISPNGPHPLAMEVPTRLDISTHSLAVQDHPSHSSTVCGTRARFRFGTSNGTIECYSTIGGLIYVNDQLFAMTTAHAFVAHALELPQSMRGESTEPNLDAHSPTASLSNNWMKMPFPTTFAYLGDVYVRGMRVDESIVDASDFALVDPASFNMLSNTYHDANRKTAEKVSGVEKTSDLCAGPVWIITSRDRYLDEGYMVEGNASIIVKGAVMPTKMIQVTMTPGLGLSGSWVVRQGKLLGVVYAGNASSSYLHMLPAERVLEEIKRVLSTDVARVATPRDIANFEAQRTLREQKDEDVTLTALPSDRPVPDISQVDISITSANPTAPFSLVNDDSNTANFAQDIERTTPHESYTAVKVLIIYWEESETLDLYRSLEAGELHIFFDNLCFQVELYKIPTQSSEVALEAFIRREQGKMRLHEAQSLLIIHYAGHGDNDDEKDRTGTGGPQKSSLVWRPGPGSLPFVGWYEIQPFVRWYEIQKLFSDVEYDVLLLFDCYCPAQVGSAKEQTAGDSDGRMELLAATCNENQTPQSGPGSFTSVIVRIMEDHIRKHNRVEISELHSELLHQKASSYTTASHVVLRVGPFKRSIILGDLSVPQGYGESSVSRDRKNNSEALRPSESESRVETSQLIPRGVVDPDAIPEFGEKAPTSRSTVYVSPDRLLKQYQQYSKYESPQAIEDMISRMELLAEILGSRRHELLHCLRLHDWNHEPHHHRFVYWFQVPIGYANRSKTLYEAITQLERQSRPTLEERLAMAFHIAKAVRDWHRFDWLHQYISPHNIIFLKRTSGSSSDRWDFDRPLLQGFGFAHPIAQPSIERYLDNIEVDIYQHPDWHRDPQDGHKREHDLYSLGAVLLDIGLWKSRQSVLGKHRETMIKEEVREMLIEAARSDLAHCVGSNYRDAVETCLTSEFSVIHDDGMEIKLLDAVEMVLQKLRPKPIL